jgi:hypothetical protein
MSPNLADGPGKAINRVVRASAVRAALPPMPLLKG